jgi:hypothetical protein
MRVPPKLVEMGRVDLTSKKYQAILGSGLVLLLATVTLVSLHTSEQAGEGGVHRRLLSKIGTASLLATEQCLAAPQFLDYTPSAWEQEWIDKAQVRKNCRS